jgi:hypothetical protein
MPRRVFSKGPTAMHVRFHRKHGHIHTDYDDDYLQLVRLLVEGAGLEHSLMIAYLYALFSIKGQYATLQGDITDRSYLDHSPVGRHGLEVVLQKDTFLDVALEEMQHLSLVNRFLCDLGAAPTFTPHIFPLSSDLYPFDIELRSLDRYASATYLWIEATPHALSRNPKYKDVSEPREFIHEVRKVLGEGSERYRKVPIDEEQVDHVGSLYRKILEQTHRVAHNPPAFLKNDCPTFPWGEWIDRMNWILVQGEITHYRFFRDVFTGKAFKADEHIWDDAPDYPTYAFTHQTAYTGRPNTIPNEKARRVAWLADLHYWIILCLLDTAYSSKARALAYKAMDNMTLGLWFLGKHLGEDYQVGVPFDSMGPHYTLGRNATFSLQILRLLVREAERKAAELDEEGLLPKGYSMNLFRLTLAGLGGS